MGGKEVRNRQTALPHWLMVSAHTWISENSGSGTRYDPPSLISWECDINTCLSWPKQKKIIPDYKFLQSFSFPQKYLLSHLAFSERKKPVSHQKHFWPTLIPVSPVRYSLGRGSGEGAPAELLPAPGATLQTHAGTRLDGAFYRLHHHLSSSLPHSWGVPRSRPCWCPIPPPRVPHRPTSLAPWVWNPVGRGPAPAGGGKLSVSPHTTSCPRSQPGCNFSSLAAVGQSRRRWDCQHLEHLPLAWGPPPAVGPIGLSWRGRRVGQASRHGHAPPGSAHRGSNILR